LFGVLFGGAIISEAAIARPANGRLHRKHETSSGTQPA
jgi:hypothetical protein